MKTKVAVLGAGFIADIHMECYHRFVPEAEVVGVYSRDVQRGQAFASKHHIPAHFKTIEQAITDSGCEVVDVCLPNFLHHRAVMAAAAAGKHVIIEKPLALTLEEGSEMIEACKRARVKLMYAEELCFAPKYERVRLLVNEGAFGRIYMLKQAEKHSGPHTDWFYDVNQSGGGVLMDMGCHGLAWFRWMLGGRPKALSVTAYMQNGLLHKGRTIGEENSVVLVEFEGGAIGMAENSWAKQGGMEDSAEVYGTGGVCYADLFQGNSALTYSEKGYGYAMEKAGSTQGWTFTVFEEAFNQGYPQELKHFITCVREDREPVITGEDGLAVLELMYAAYESAGSGRKVELPFGPKIAKPVDLWLKGQGKSG
ncbi:MAG TPA: Gfo/Idh/MocA family oxidoreductase [Candidatus Saccharimonadales bacterium]|nr:Gfo/Idh/MocA family oxidoreductase [Candidatus Saccharimonadales bacterium]